MISSVDDVHKWHLKHIVFMCSVRLILLFVVTNIPSFIYWHRHRQRQRQQWRLVMARRHPMVSSIRLSLCNWWWVMLTPLAPWLTHKSIFAVLKLSKQNKTPLETPSSKNNAQQHQRPANEDESRVMRVTNSVEQQQQEQKQQHQQHPATTHQRRIGFAKQKENNYRWYLSRFVTAI